MSLCAILRPLSPRLRIPHFSTRRNATRTLHKGGNPSPKPNGFFQRGPEYFSGRHELLKTESSLVGIRMAPITTVTFFSGVSSTDVAEAVQGRLGPVLEANPWLAGRVVKQQGESSLHLVYPEMAQGDCELIDELLQVEPDDLQLQLDTPYADLVESVMSSSASVDKLSMGYLWRSEVADPALITRATVLSTRDGAALVFSMSHAVVDGHTYYQILNMLSEGATITSLSPQRKHEATPKMITAQGALDHKYLTGALGLKGAFDKLSSKPGKASCHFVDEARVAELKTTAMQTAPADVRFVSTNDVLVSEFAKLYSARLFLMALNFRERVDGVQNEDVGNYSSMLMLDEAVYRTPGTLRQCMQTGPPFMTHSKPLPGIWEAIHSEYAAVTNWAGFGGSLRLAGTAQTLHLPVTNSMPFDCCYIFKPSPGKLGLLIFSKRFTSEELVEALPLGDAVSEPIFGPM